MGNRGTGGGAFLLIMGFKDYRVHNDDLMQYTLGREIPNLKAKNNIMDKRDQGGGSGRAARQHAR